MHSVINRSPPELLHEVILVDDSSKSFILITSMSGLYNKSMGQCCTLSSQVGLFIISWQVLDVDGIDVRIIRATE
jgi:hypothetical protein